MKKTLIFITVLILCSDISLAIDGTTVIDSIKSEVESTRDQSNNNNSRIQGLEADLASEAVARQSEDQYLQDQIDTIELTPGPSGADGLNCWDLNGSGTCDTETEDKTDDGTCDALDCQGQPAEVTPPTVDSSVTCIDAFTMILNLNIVDDTEIAYYAIQEQGGDPPLNIITFVEPGVNVVDYGLTANVGPEVRIFLLVASDIEGKMSKSLVQVDPDICLGSCPGGAICP